MKFPYFFVFLLFISIATTPGALAQIKSLPVLDCTTKLGINCPKVADEASALSLIRSTITRPLGIILSFLSLLALILLIYAGFKYIWARGDDKETEKAKNIILYTIIGLIVIGLAGIIVNTVIRIAFNR